MERSVIVAAPIDVAYDRVLGDDLTGFFDRGHRMLPAIAGTSDLVGTGRWGTTVGGRAASCSPTTPRWSRRCARRMRRIGLRTR